MKISRPQVIAQLVLAATMFIPAFAASPMTKDGVTTIHLTEYNGYFAAQETLTDLKPGEYDFVVTNKAGKFVGFNVQDQKTHELLGGFGLNPNETKTARVTVTANGFRYRCPINVTPWYDVDMTK
ncbi:hypothetical protein GCM10007907_22650 [Chitinimonas prasina]|uniref:EfeO-type cupredoxin-like domain-containing protein n=1 Tax=Chitinimonas prasina TaxID=1434937 RepID=A0ABQ5YEQ5_9NEIS|nr:hypothetical protein [Chitinimonas prasina]GLR13475.1 hypothetical protein GCM10007907_22650 [Chitinimonas prasina]